jgi:hypothetical protein
MGVHAGRTANSGAAPGLHDTIIPHGQIQSDTDLALRDLAVQLVGDMQQVPADVLASLPDHWQQCAREAERIAAMPGEGSAP